MPGKALIITGASSGIGAATAVLAARQGWRVLVNYRSDLDAAENIVDQIRKNEGIAKSFCADISDESAVVQLFEFTNTELGPIGGLVNNAAIMEKQMRVIDMDGARLNRMFSVNISGSFLCAREAIKYMSSARGGAGGAIVNVSSAASRLGSAGEYVDYAASKGALDTLTIGLANEVACEGIRVNAVRPGFIETGIHAKGGEPDRMERVRNNIPLNRPGKPEEVADAILWLLSEQSSYCTGSFIDIAGGR